MNKSFFKKIISHEALHAKWLNTLSYFENCGARLIAKSENPTMVPKEILKHAAEEFRHAYFFKAQITKVTSHPYQSYKLSSMLGAYKTKFYLHQVNNLVSKFLKSEKKVYGERLKELAYLFVTYLIELRALEIYQSYQATLKERGSKISILAIIREETHHLQEITDNLEKQLEISWLNDLLKIEKPLFEEWKNRVTFEVNDTLESELRQLSPG